MWVFKEGTEPQLTALPKASRLELPLSKKKYKTTLKNVKVYISELLQLDTTITRVEIERATHIGSFERKQNG